MTIEDALLWRLRERAIVGERRALQLQQKILSLAAKAYPQIHYVDVEALKLRLAKMVGLLPELDAPEEDKS